MVEEDEAQEAQALPWYQPFHKVMECSHQCCTDIPKEDCSGDCCNQPSSPRKKRLSLNRSKSTNKKTRLKEIPDIMLLQNPHTGEPKLMKKRKIPAVLRFHKFNPETNPSKFFLQELILFVPFGLPQNGDMENVLKEPDDRITILFAKYQEHIREVKSQALPFLEDVEEARFYVDKVKKELDVEEVGRLMAAGKEQDNMYAMDEEIREDPDFAAIDPDLLEEIEEEGVRISDYGRIIIPNKKELVQKTRGLDKDQRMVLDIAVKYAKDIKKARSRGERRPDPPHMMVHGAAGTGEITN